MYGSDAAHSLEPKEFADLAKGVRAIETMLTSKVDMNDASRFSVMKQIFEKSVVSLVKIPKGKVITATMVGCKKPGTGIQARRLDEIIGKKARKDIPADSLIRETDLL